MAKRKHTSKRSKSIGKRIGDGFNALTEWIEKFFKSIFGSVGKTASFFGSLLIPTALTKRFDRATKSTGKSVGKRVGAITEHVEKKFSKGATGILSSLGFIFKIFLPKPVVDWFSNRSKAMSNWMGSYFRRMGKWLGSLAERYLPKWLVLAFKRFSAHIRRLQRTASKFTTAWWKSRNYNALAWATPAFVLAIPTLAVLVFATIHKPPAKIAHYSSVMFTALEEQEFDKAELFRQKLRQLGYGQMERVEFNNAIALAKNKDMPGAYAKMLEIASLLDDESPSPPEATSVGSAGDEEEAPAPPVSYTPAHIWIASSLLNNVDEEGHEIVLVDEEQRLPLCIQHIDAALRNEPDHLHGRFLKVRYLVKTHQITAAIETMEELVREYPQLNGELMQYYAAIGKQFEARKSAKGFSRHAKSTKRNRRTANDYYFWFTALEIIGDTERALEVAQMAGQDYPNDPKVRILAKKAAITRLATTRQSDPQYPNVLIDAHRFDPDNEAVTSKLARRWVYEPLEMDPLIQQMIDDKAVSARVFLVAGELHSAGGRNDEAIRRFEQAIQFDDQCAPAYNNLAWIRANVPPLRIRDALVSVTKAIDIDPQATFFETRGQIHFQLDELQQAATDLERAINGGLAPKDQLNSHETLAKIYKRLGKPEQASAHDARAKRLQPRLRSS